LAVTLTSATLRPFSPSPTSPTPASPARVAHLWFSLRPRSTPPDGRVRLSLSLPAGILPASRSLPLPLSVHLHVAAPASILVQALGAHGASKAWMPSGAVDPWHRDAAFFGWDATGEGGMVTQERRVYMGGLSDEAGASAGVAMAIKQVGARVGDCCLACSGVVWDSAPGGAMMVRRRGGRGTGGEQGVMVCTRGHTGRGMR
jgi:hypothetical protein